MESASVDHIENVLISPVELESASSMRGWFSRRHGLWVSTERSRWQRPTDASDSVTTHDRCPAWTATGRTGRRVADSLEQPCGHQALSKRLATPSHGTPWTATSTYLQWRYCQLFWSSRLPTNITSHRPASWELVNARPCLTTR